MSEDDSVTPSITSDDAQKQLVPVVDAGLVGPKGHSDGWRKILAIVVPPVIALAGVVFGIWFEGQRHQDTLSFQSEQHALSLQAARDAEQAAREDANAAQEALLRFQREREDLGNFQDQADRYLGAMYRGAELWAEAAYLLGGASLSTPSERGPVLERIGQIVDEYSVVRVEMLGAADALRLVVPAELADSIDAYYLGLGFMPGPVGQPWEEYVRDMAELASLAEEGSIQNRGLIFTLRQELGEPSQVGD